MKSQEGGIDGFGSVRVTVDLNQESTTFVPDVLRERVDVRAVKHKCQTKTPEANCSKILWLDPVRRSSTLPVEHRSATRNNSEYMGRAHQKTEM